MNKFLIAALLVSNSVMADQFGPYNQQQTYNYNTGCSSWQSCFGPGINTAGVALISGLVNAMSRPDPVVVVSPNQQQYQQQAGSYRNPQDSYIQQQQGYNQVPNRGNCSMQTLYDRSGNPRYVKICD